jgi:uncharacterized protein
VSNLVRRYPVITFHTIAFGWTWLIVFLLILSGQTRDMSVLTPFFIIGGIISGISPSMAAFIVSSVSEGKEGVEKLKIGFKTKNPFKWYALALLTVPAVTAVVTFISNYVVRPYELNIVMPIIIMGLVWPIFSSCGEEFGWRGYILPRLLLRHTPLKAGIILGVIWEIWHLPMHYIAFKAFGSYMIPVFLTVGFINLTLQSIIMTLIFIKSKGSIKLMILYHYTITASSILVGALLTAETKPRLIFNESVISVLLFAIVAIVLYIKNKNFLNNLKGEYNVKDVF